MNLQDLLDEQITIYGLSRLTKIPDSTLRRWTESGVLSAPKKSKQPLSVWLSELVKHLQVDPDQGDALKEARTQKERLQSEVLKIKILRESGQLVVADEIALVHGKAVNIAKTNMLALPSQLSAELASCASATEISELLTDAIHQALSEVTDSLMKKDTFDDIQPQLQEIRSRLEKSLEPSDESENQHD